MLLAKCPRLVGQCNLVTDPLRIATHRDLRLRHFSLYDRDGAMVLDSGFFRGIPTYGSIGGPLRIDDPEDEPVAPDGDFLWIGKVITHYGHFLVDVLARLWAWPLHAGPETRLAYLGNESPEDLFGIAYIRCCLSALGIGPERLFQVAGPIRFPRITVPEPAFVENFSIAPAYADTLRTIADALLPDRPSIRGDRLVYLSKARLASGNRLIVNENELSERLAKRGIETVYPESLSFPDQLRLWAQTRCALGFAGSAFHTAGFVGRRRLVTLSNTIEASSNQAMIDRVAGNDSLFLHPIHALSEEQSTVAGFHDAIVIRDPDWLAGEITKVLDGFLGGRVRSQTVQPRPRSTWAAREPTTAFGQELGRAGTLERRQRNDWRLALAEIYSVSAITVTIEPTLQGSDKAAPRSTIEVSGNAIEWFDLAAFAAVIESEQPGRLVWRTPFLTLARHVRVKTDAGYRILDLEVLGERADGAIGLPAAPPRHAESPIRAFLANWRLSVRRS